MNQEPEAITLTGEYVWLCRSLLCTNLLRVCELLASGKDGSGDQLTTHSKRELVGFSNKLQLTLLVFGLTSAELGKMVRDFSKRPK